MKVTEQKWKLVEVLDSNFDSKSKWAPIQTDEYAFDLTFPPCVKEPEAREVGKLVAAAPLLLKTLRKFTEVNERYGIGGAGLEQYQEVHGEAVKVLRCFE